MATDVNSLDDVNQTTTQTEAKRDDREINFERLRKKTEALESALNERDQMLKQQQAMLEQMQARFQPQSQDEFDSLPDEELIDKAKFKRALEKEREKLRQEAEEIARRTYQKIDNENFASKLKMHYPDYEDVVSKENAEKLQEQDPDFVALLAEVKDDFKRREMAYKRMKKLAQAEVKPKVKAQDVVEENRKASGAYYTPSGQGPMANPYAFEFDVRSKDAKAKAYERLKAAQKRAF